MYLQSTYKQKQIKKISGACMEFYHLVDGIFMLLLLVNKVIPVYMNAAQKKIDLIYRLARVGAKSIGKLINITLEIPLSQKA